MWNTGVGSHGYIQPVRDEKKIVWDMGTPKQQFSS